MSTAMIRAAKAGDQAAFAALRDEWGGLLRKICRGYFPPPGCDANDVYQHALIGLWKAVRDFDADLEDGASFRNFMALCVQREVITMIKTATRQKHSMLNGADRLERPGSDGAHDGDEVLLGDIVPGGVDPVRHLLNLEATVEVLRRLASSEFSDMERQVAELRMQGRTYEVIAEMIGGSTKQVDNTVQRVAFKLRKPPRELPFVWRHGLTVVRSAPARRPVRAVSVPAESYGSDMSEFAVNAMKAAKAEMETRLARLLPLIEEQRSLEQSIRDMDKAIRRAEGKASRTPARRELPAGEKLGPGGRVQNPEGTMSERILRVMLPEGTMTVPQIIEATGMDSGQVSTELSRMCQKGILVRPGRGFYRLARSAATQAA